ncbi:imidazoleglycerol-phosphate dehydratase HisB [Alicyclobacillus mali]|uniref:Imidazoleglycerol-phosphate dehydratase n=1 Tax=Alicyclobacillus mali (ex Roth et al. 2021) TaxID=1123961 RepID=A0ABS0F3A5_9BACL|nr:imidazoleglycerol-phosphate dehydratase HisB [Alicyclobacillus mali (ex Roth et al. 2021)]MBF8377768.1 imidazoleglycerol-phosphate dehydratase HisB [Alicyclobacillus mali (ex Roth et al. 2021)]MCL6488737.1 imidazoleglycerol-phosphate dehydratase HisB [Alicyclobacillus mali (ex Roth et al. 2021)]
MSSSMERPTFSAAIERETGETSVRLSLNLHGQGRALMDFPVPFLRHMLHLFTVHGSFDLTVSATGDVDVDDHHLVEDIGLCLGRAIREALGNKAGIRRYGERHVPMDETLARAVIDLSGRPAFVLYAGFTDARIGTFPTELVHEFFKSVANEARMALHLAVLYGENNHHMAEALFKAFGQALREAVEVTEGGVRSSKGVLE